MPIDTSALLRDAFCIASEQEQAPQRHFCLEIPQELPKIQGDYDLLLLAIYNVLNNAIKYSFDGDQIRLQAQSNNNLIIISISDTGPGIAIEDLPYVWDELYRSENVKGTSGSGIGLALVRRIIERHGGVVSIESTINRGTTVYMVLAEAAVSE